jgi:hypothetical protein
MGLGRGAAALRQRALRLKEGRARRLPPRDATLGPRLRAAAAAFVNCDGRRTHSAPLA